MSLLLCCRLRSSGIGYDRLRLLLLLLLLCGLLHRIGLSSCRLDLLLLLLLLRCWCWSSSDRLDSWSRLLLLLLWRRLL